MEVDISAFDVCRLCTCTSGSLDTLLPPHRPHSWLYKRPAGCTSLWKATLLPQPASNCTLFPCFGDGFIHFLLTFKESAIWPLRFCCAAVGMVQHLSLEPFQPHWGAQEGLAVVPSAHSPPWKSWGNQRRWAGIGVDTNFINFSLSAPVFNYFLDSASVYRKNDKTPLSFKNSIIEANLFVSQLKSKMHVLTRSGNDHHCFFKSWGNKCHCIWDTVWFRELATSCLVNAVLVMLPGARSLPQEVWGLKMAVLNIRAYSTGHHFPDWQFSWFPVGFYVEPSHLGIG